jgi:rRNA maturation endonuclease Nob1
VEESDAEMVNLVAEEVDEDESLPNLSPADVKLGKCAVTKVRSCLIIGIDEC